MKHLLVLLTLSMLCWTTQAQKLTVESEDFHIGLLKRTAGGGAALLFENSNAETGIIGLDVNNRFFTQSPDALYLQTGGGNTRMFIDDIGNVGIGTASPNDKLEVQSGNICITTPAARESRQIKINRGTEGKDIAAVSFGENNTYGWHAGLLYGGGVVTPDFYISTDSDVNSHTPEFTITDSGDVGIGRTTPSAKLDVYRFFPTIQGTSSTDILSRFRANDNAFDIVSYYSGGNAQYLRLLPNQIASQFGQHIFQIGTSADPWSDIYSSKFYAFDGSSYLTYSDLRLKTNIRPIENAMNIILKLKGKIYNKDLNKLISKERRGKENVIENEPGFIAQEVEKVLPQIVHADEEGESYKSVGLMGMIPYLVEAFKELKQEKDEEIALRDEAIATLQNEVQTLRNELNEIKVLLQNSAIKPTNPDNSTSLNENTQLGQNIPNPFGQDTMIPFFIPQQVKQAILQITAVDGSIIEKMVITERGQGRASVSLDTTGTYFYSLFLDGQLVDTKQMMSTKN